MLLPGAGAKAPARRLRRVLGQLLQPSPAAAGGRAGPLAGVKVLDFCQFQNGPSATAQLADNGADVLKIEPPQGDGLRTTGKPGTFESGVENFNRGKRSITLDLKHPSAREVLERLVKWADVVTENFRPGVMQKLGLGYEDCKKLNPRIVYASNSGFGPEGEWAPRPSFDGIAQAFSGVMTAMGGGPSHQPMRIEWTFADEVGAMNFLSSILMGLVARDRTGQGQEILTSQTAATLFFQRASVTRNLRAGFQRDDGEPPGHAMRAGQMLCQGGDGLWMMISPGARGQMKRFLVEALQRPDIFEDKRLRRETEEEKNWFLLEVQKTIATRPRQHWLDACLAADVPSGPCASYKDIGDPENSVGKHLRANGYILNNKHRYWGDLTVVGQPTRYLGTPNAPVLGSWHSPDLGEHQEEVLKELGYSNETIAELVEVHQARGPYAPKKENS